MYEPRAQEKDQDPVQTDRQTISCKLPTRSMRRSRKNTSNFLSINHSYTPEKLMSTSKDSKTWETPQSNIRTTGMFYGALYELLMTIYQEQ